MRVLLDTHAFLWWNAGDDRLSRVASEVIRDGRNQILISVASIWEVAIKVAKGQLELPEDVQRYVDARLASNRWLPLSIEPRHAVRAGGLPPLHRDPFDRVLIAQSQVEAIPSVTTDTLIHRYDVETIW